MVKAMKFNMIAKDSYLIVTLMINGIIPKNCNIIQIVMVLSSNKIQLVNLIDKGVLIVKVSRLHTSAFALLPVVPIRDSNSQPRRKLSSQRPRRGKGAPVGVSALVLSKVRWARVSELAVGIVSCIRNCQNDG